jgi:hypothetical protein
MDIFIFVDFNTKQSHDHFTLGATCRSAPARKNLEDKNRE